MIEWIENGSGSWKGICASERFGANMVECEWLSRAGSPSSRLTNGYPPTLSLPTLHVTHIYPPLIYSTYIPHTFTHPHHHKQCTYSWVHRTTGSFKVFAHTDGCLFVGPKKKKGFGYVCNIEWCCWALDVMGIHPAAPLTHWHTLGTNDISPGLYLN